MTINYLNPPSKSINAEVNLAGSKSIANRALLIASMADGTSVLENIPFSHDVLACIECLEKIGVSIVINQSQASVMIKGVDGHLPETSSTLHTYEAGTLTRFLVPLLATQVNQNYILNASSRMQRRPLGDLLHILESQGTKFDFHIQNYSLPLTLKARGLQGGRIKVPGEKSSQFLSGLLLASPYSLHDVYLQSQSKVEQPYVQMTKDVMSAFGVSVFCPAFNDYRVTTKERYQARSYAIEPDLSTASYFWAVAALSNGAVQVNHTDFHSIQGDIRFLSLLKQMGCQVIKTDQGIQVIGAARLYGIEANMRTFSDTFMTIAVIALFAETPTYLHGLAHTRLQESDRLMAIYNNLVKIGACVKITTDSITIYPKSSLYSAQLDGYNDHRVAMASALIGLKIPGITINGSECVQKTCPDYFERMNSLLKNDTKSSH